MEITYTASLHSFKIALHALPFQIIISHVGPLEDRAVLGSGSANTSFNVNTVAGIQVIVFMKASRRTMSAK